MGLFARRDRDPESDPQNNQNPRMKQVIGNRPRPNPDHNREHADHRTEKRKCLHRDARNSHRKTGKKTDQQSRRKYRPDHGFRDARLLVFKSVKGQPGMDRGCKEECSASNARNIRMRFAINHSWEYDPCARKDPSV